MAGLVPSPRLADLAVLALDCQASGATPAHGELLEMGWTVLGSLSAHPIRAHWTRIQEPPSMPIRKLTGWTPSCLEHAIDPVDVWRAMVSDAVAVINERPIPTVIHYARFELPFLRDLLERSGADRRVSPLDVVCLHAVAARLFPELPRRNIRALAGHLGHSASMIRRASGHVEATAFLWRELVPRLNALQIETWEDLKQWLDIVPVPSSGYARRGKREFPIDAAKRKALPDGPGVYRFVRSNGDVLYVGKAMSVKKRVASHFSTAARSRATERALEMLTQAHDIEVTSVPTAVEAALLEADEIKRLDPPYNVQLRVGDRGTWFASRSWMSTAPHPDEAHVIGPLPSSRSLAGSAAMVDLLAFGREPTDERRAAIAGVPAAFGPDAALFAEVFSTVTREHRLVSSPRSTLVRRSLIAAALRIDPRLFSEDEEATSGEEVATWDAPRLRRHIERTLFVEVMLIKRASLLALLTDAHVAFREDGTTVVRHLVLAEGSISERYDSLSTKPKDHPLHPPRRDARLTGFDRRRYDRLRVLVTELRRVMDEGGDVAIHVGAHTLRVASSKTPQRRRSSKAGSKSSLSSGDEAMMLPWSSTKT